MNRVCFLLFVLLAVVVVPDARAGSVVVNFDDLGNGTIASPYGGIDWLNNWYNYTNAQDPYNPHSGASRIIIFGDGVVETLFEFLTPALFKGAWIAGEGVEAPGISFNLYFGGNLVGTSSTLIQSGTPTFLASDYAGLVDRVGVVGEAGRFAVDDVTYDTVPEPATALLSLAAIGLGIATAKMRRLRIAWNSSLATADSTSEKRQ